MNEKEKQ